MAEGSSTPEEAISAPSEAKTTKFDQFGEIVGTSKPEEKPREEWVDPDDLPQNQGMTPAVNLARLRQRLNNAKPVEVTPIGELKELPATPPPQRK